MSDFYGVTRFSMRYLAAVAMLASLAACAPQTVLLTAPEMMPETIPVAPAYPAALAGAYFPLASEHTGRSYHIHIRLPDGYDPDAAAPYPVVYVLDGDSLWPILAATHLFATYDDGIPEAIIVGVAYGSFAPEINHRDVDFTPPGGEAPQEQAGATTFAQFLKDELLPLVESRYQADPDRRVLFGQSLSGGFALYSAFTDPDLFWGRIASNPVFARGVETYYTAPSPASRGDLKLVVTSGEHDRPALRASAEHWRAAWADRDDRPWALRVITIAGGTHAANSPESYRVGMRWLFALEH